MVPLAAVPSEFAGRVLVAKLGSAGILAELRGVSNVYPTVFDRPQVWVEAAEEAEARELISADLDDELPADPSPRRPAAAASSARLVLIALAVLVLVVVTVGTRSCSPTTGPTSAKTR